MEIHDLKSWPVYFIPTWEREKTLELRYNDRNFQVGDQLVLREFDYQAEIYTGRFIIVEITHIVLEGPWLQPGYVGLSYQVISQGISWPKLEY